jgi:hypothetical protein
MYSRATTIMAAGSLCLAAAAISSPMPVRAQIAQAPCDSITSGGWVLKSTGDWANFAAQAGCRSGRLQGHVNYVDHQFGFHLESTQITAYLADPARPNARDICGRGRVNDSSFEVSFRIHLEDNGEPGWGYDVFGIAIDGWKGPGGVYLQASNTVGGNVQLQRVNAGGRMPALHEPQACAGLASP